MLRSASPWSRCLARTRPSTTGLTISRWLGFGASERWTLPPSVGFHVGGEAEVVLHVAVAVGGGLRQVVVLELVEDLGERLVERVGEHVQPAAVGHADDELLDAQRRALLDDRVEDRDERLAAFEREPLLADVLGVQELLEQLGLVERDEDAVLLLQAEREAVADRLHPLGQPVADVERVDVHELDADRCGSRSP